MQSLPPPLSSPYHCRFERHGDRWGLLCCNLLRPPLLRVTALYVRCAAKFPPAFALPTRHHYCEQQSGFNRIYRSFRPSWQVVRLDASRDVSVVQPTLCYKYYCCDFCRNSLAFFFFWQSVGFLVSMNAAFIVRGTGIWAARKKNWTRQIVSCSHDCAW